MFLDRKSNRPANTVTKNEFHKFYKIYTRFSGAMQDAHSKKYPSQSSPLFFPKNVMYSLFGLLNNNIATSLCNNHAKMLI